MGTNRVQGGATNAVPEWTKKQGLPRILTRSRRCYELLAGQLIRHRLIIIDHFTVVCSVTWPLYGSEARVDLVLIQTSLLFSFK